MTPIKAPPKPPTKATPPKTSKTTKTHGDHMKNWIRPKPPA